MEGLKRVGGGNQVLGRKRGRSALSLTACRKKKKGGNPKGEGRIVLEFYRGGRVTRFCRGKVGSKTGRYGGKETLELAGGGKKTPTDLSLVDDGGGRQKPDRSS